MTQQTHSSETTDLASILQTLAAFAPQQPQQQYPSIHPTRNHSFTNHAALSIPQHRPPLDAPAPPIDPATITTWPAGLRCISKIDASNPALKYTVRRMMDDQAKHERQWWEARQVLLERQAARGGKSAQLQGILGALGGSTHTENAASDEPADVEKELTAYDTKVWRAQRDMLLAMEREMKRLGVPFFGTREELIVADELGSEIQAKGKITRRELVTMQRRMVQHLEDLYAEET